MSNENISSTLERALASGASKEFIWEEYKKEWKSLVFPEMPPKTFCNLFYNSKRAKQAVEFARKSDGVKASLLRSLEQLGINEARKIFNHSGGHHHVVNALVDPYMAWGILKSILDDEFKHGIDPNILSKLLRKKVILEDAISLSDQSFPVAMNFRRTLVGDKSILFREPDLINFWNSVWNWRSAIESWDKWRLDKIAVERETAIGKLIRLFLKIKGREIIRPKILQIWGNVILMEEEKEAIIRVLGRGNALTEELLRDLGPDAEHLAMRLVKRGEILGYWLFNDPPGSISSVRSSTTSKSTCKRISSLLQWVSIPADLRDSWLKSEELSRLKDQHSMYSAQAGGYFINAARNLAREFKSKKSRNFVRFIENAASILKKEGNNLHNKNYALRFLLIQVLHMRLIMESPVLSSAAARPEESLVPELLLYVLGRDAAMYSPELRVQNHTERRWRARWVECMGEAISALFLEKAVDIDLTTLDRIPERNDRKTADFRACTREEEPIVFEAKGSTHWNTHRAQRKKALEQIGKEIKDGVNAFDWATSKGRAFACCLFAAVRGDERSSLFHAVDPPFAFMDLFGKGWKDEARRRHYAAVLEAARLYDARDRLLHRWQPESHAARKPVFFHFDSGREREDQPTFAGSTIDVLEMARAIGHPSPGSFEGVKLFIGVDERIYRHLAKGELPPRPKVVGEESDGGRPGGMPRQRAGLLPPDRDDGRGGGVFSQFADGSFVAITAGP